MISGSDPVLTTHKYWRHYKLWFGAMPQNATEREIDDQIREARLYKIGQFAFLLVETIAAAVLAAIYFNAPRVIAAIIGVIIALLLGAAAAAGVARRVRHEAAGQPTKQTARITRGLMVLGLPWLVACVTALSVLRSQIVAMLEKGTAPWQKPWEPGVLQIPLNPTTGKVYRGGNALHLMAVAGRKGFEDPRWLTYRQAQEQGWQVRQGEKGTHIEFWQFPEHERDRESSEKPNAARSSGDDTDRGDTRTRMLHRIYTVFNGQQIDGIPEYAPQKTQEWEAVQAGERILVNSGARITHDQDDRAFYSPASDKIHLPPREAFKNASDYYGTALHELSHWSGHPTRLNRETLNESYRFGDTNYAKEELRAELASVFLAAEKGIPHNPEQHAAYVASWIQTLKNDKNEIFRAAKDAHAAADYLIAFDKELPKDRSPQEPVRTETADLVAAREPATGAATVAEKQTATESRLPVEASPKGLADESLAAAQDLTKRVFGEKAKHYLADTESGTYRGVIVAETAQHLVQRISPKSVAIHDKALLPSSVAPGANVLVSYSNNVAQVRPYKARQRAQALAR